MTTRFAIEGRDNQGEWSEDSVRSCGDPEEVNRYDSEEEAEQVIEELARTFECSTSKFRVVEV